MLLRSIPAAENQTKLEIRTLVSEVANLASSDLSWSGLSRRNATAHLSSNGRFQRLPFGKLMAAIDLSLAGHCRLPSSLLPVASSDQSAPADESCADHHQRILACVASEGSAVLVPPRSTKLSADRPANPLDESLLIVPIKIFERHETLLEVIQPHSGGPAAQRGYLRFVAQMETWSQNICVCASCDALRAIPTTSNNSAERYRP